MGAGKTETTVDKNGTIIYNGSSEFTKSNHSGMPKRSDAYLPTDERGHVQASSLGGDNSKENVVPMDKELNHGAYYQMEGQERDILTSCGEIQSEKIAFASNQAGQRPDAFIVNDRVTYADGRMQIVHLSFQNASSELQESWADSVMEHSDMLDDLPNKGDALREEMTEKEYATLMEETDEYLSDIRDDYSPHVYREHGSESEDLNSTKSDFTTGNSKDTAPDLAVQDETTELGNEFADGELSFDTKGSSAETTDVSDVNDGGGSDSGGLM